MGLVEAGGLALEVGEEIVAEVELDLARGADEDLAGDEEEDGGGGGDGEQAEGVEEKLLRVTPVRRSSTAWPMTMGSTALRVL